MNVNDLIARRGRPVICLFGWFALLVSSAGAQVLPGSLGVYADASVEAWSNGLPILALDGKWSKGYLRRSDTQRAYASARAEAGALLSEPSVGGGAWRVGVLARADVSTRMSGQAGQVLYHYQSGTDPEQPATYNVDTDTRFWIGKGVAFHTSTVRWGGIQVAASWDHMTLQRLRSIQTLGEVSYDATDTYGFRGSVRDDSDKTTTPYMAAPANAGLGDAVSMTATWLSSDRNADRLSTWLPTCAKLKIEDAWSRLSWEGINGDDAVLNSNVRQRDPDGRIEYRAAINGKYTRRVLVERIPVAVQAQVEWARPDGLWSLRVRERLGLWQHWVGWQSAGAVRYRMEVEPMAGAIAMGLEWRSLVVSVMADRLDSAARAKGAKLSVALPF